MDVRRGDQSGLRGKGEGTAGAISSDSSEKTGPYLQSTSQSTQQAVITTDFIIRRRKQGPRAVPLTTPLIKPNPTPHVHAPAQKGQHNAIWTVGGGHGGRQWAGVHSAWRGQSISRLENSQQKGIIPDYTSVGQAVVSNSSRCCCDHPVTCGGSD